MTDLFSGQTTIEVLTEPAKDDTGQILSGLMNYSIEIISGNKRFFDAWKMGNEEQINAELKAVIDGIESGVIVKVRKGEKP
jgi:hypothetical protein